MKVQTSRFGEIEADQSRIITFPKGLMGLPAHKKYVLVSLADDAAFWWLQSVDIPDLAFIVSDPDLVAGSHDLPPAAGGEQLFVIINKHDGVLTANMLGPLVIHMTDFVGRQVIAEGQDSRAPIAVA